MCTRSSLHGLGALVLLALSAACSGTVNTVPPVVSPSAPAREYTLELPAELEIRSVDYSASLYSDVSGGAQVAITSSTGGRAFVKVYAVHRRTGEQYLLLYENIASRAQPVHIIRFRSAGNGVLERP
jgi:hypothetical protein